MAITSYIRRMFKNGVSVVDTVPAGFSLAATSFTAADGSSFPDGSIGPFIITADQGLNTEEKILISSRSGSVFTVASSGRGYNGTAAAAHASGCSILHTIDAQDMDEANQTMAQTIGAIAAKGDLLVGSAANTLTKLAIGTTTQTLQVVSGTLSYVGFGSGRSQNVGAANADGTDTTYARSDHVHSGVTTFMTRNGAVTLSAADVESILTAAGQLIVGTGSGTGELLAKGSAGTVLAVGGADASGLEWFNGPTGAVINTSQSTGSTAYTDLGTVGPAVTLTTGTSAIVTLGGTLSNNTQNDYATMSFAVSGATTLAASTALAVSSPALTDPAGTTVTYSNTLFVSGLTAGSNTFTAKYAAGVGGTATFANRHICVFPLLP